MSNTSATVWPRIKIWIVKRTELLVRVLVGLLLAGIVTLFVGQKYCDPSTSPACRVYDAIAPSPSKEGVTDRSVAEAFFQFGIVVGISILWFIVFLKSKEKTWKIGHKTRFLSLLIAIGFAIAMRSEYVPAVFVMALVAIFVAAEHYGGLRESTHTLNTVQSVLAESNSTLQIAQNHIENMETSLRSSNKELQRSNNLLVAQQTILEQAKKDLGDQQIRVERLANSLRLSKFKPEVYQAYSIARDRIDAVIRVFDIDSVWWQQDADDPWTRYQELPKTLYWALTATAPVHTPIPDPLSPTVASVDMDDILVPSGVSRESGTGDVHRTEIRTDQVLFICEMPWPTSFFQEQQKDSKEAKAERFNSLLGLTWWLTVLTHVRRYRHMQWTQHCQDELDATFPYVRMVTAHCPSWMHAVDQTVFQMTQGERWEQSSVSELTMAQDEFERRRLSNWAHDNIRHHARRGREAESYVCALFLYAAAKTRHLLGDPLENALDRILRTLGLDEWLELRVGELGVSKFENKRPNTEKLCRRLFADFLTTLGVSVGAEPLVLSPHRVVTFEHLLSTLS